MAYPGTFFRAFRGLNGAVVWSFAVLAMAAALVWFAAPLRQNEIYHSFADQRTVLLIPRFWNVVSNLPFLWVGLVGLRRFRHAAASCALFAGVALVAAGSAYYHLDPSDHRLVWDRLPMTLVFMSATVLVLREWSGRRWCERLLAPLLLFGCGSVLWWRFTGDLRLYAVVQFAPALLLAPALISSAPVRPLWPAVFFYVLAKVAEEFDTALYLSLPLSGHTLKHLLAALATYWIYRWNCTCFATEAPKLAPPPDATPTAA